MGTLVDTPERNRSERPIVAGVAAVGLAVSAVGLIVTLSDLLRNFHDGEAEYLFPRTFWWLAALVFSVVTLAVWRSQTNRSLGSVAVRWLVTLAFAGAALWGGFLLLKPLDLGRYEAYCQPLALETVGRSNPSDRCNDPERFIGGVVLFVGGVTASVLSSHRSRQGHAAPDPAKA